MARRGDALDLLALGLVGLGATLIIKNLVSTGETRELSDAVDPLDFGVAYSTNGGAFQFVGDVDDHTRPQPPFKTLTEARRVARQFIACSTPIQGRAKVVNVRTGNEEEVCAR